MVQLYTLLLKHLHTVAEAALQHHNSCALENTEHGSNSEEDALAITSQQP